MSDFRPEYEPWVFEDPSPSPSPDHPRIWLQPEDEAEHDTGRMWCQYNEWGDKATEYVRADELSRLRADLENWQSRSAERDAECDRRAKAQWAAEEQLASMREALTEIAEVRRGGLQGIREDYPDEAEYNLHAMHFWAREAERIRSIARAALKEGTP